MEHGSKRKIPIVLGSDIASHPFSIVSIASTCATFIPER
jgi:hypothetical protein